MEQVTICQERIGRRDPAQAYVLARPEAAGKTRAADFDRVRAVNRLASHARLADLDAFLNSYCMG